MSAASFPRRALRLEEEPDCARLDPPAELADTIACRNGALDEGIRAPQRFIAPACPEEGDAELRFKGEVEPGGGFERGGALE